MKKSNQSYAILITLIYCIFVNFSCGKDDPLQNKDREDPNLNPIEKDTIINKEELKDYILIDKCKELGEWDNAILGLDGSALYYKFNDEKLPEEVRVWDNMGDSLVYIVKFNKKGLPSCFILGEYTYIIENQTDKTIDVAIVESGKLIYADKGIKCDYDWDEYQKTILKTETKAFNPSLSPIKWINTALSATSCAISAAAVVASSGTALVVATPFMILSCGSALSGIMDLLFDTQSTSLTWVMINHYANLVNCAVLYNPVSCLINITSNVTTIGDLFMDDRRYNDIKKGKDGIFLANFEANIEIKDITILDNLHVLIDFHAEANISNSDISENDIRIGICYSLKNKPTVDDQLIYIGKEELMDMEGDINGEFTLLDLYRNVKYNYRTFIQVNDAIFYGELKSFRSGNGTLNIVGKWTQGFSYSQYVTGKSETTPVYTFFDNGTYMYESNPDKIHYIFDYSSYTEDRLAGFITKGKFSINPEDQYLKEEVISNSHYYIYKTYNQSDGLLVNTESENKEDIIINDQGLTGHLIIYSNNEFSILQSINEETGEINCSAKFKRISY